MADSEILKIPGIGPKVAKTLEDCGYNTIEKIVKVEADELSQLPGVGLATAEKIITGAKEIQKAEKKTAPKPAAKKPTAKQPIPKPPAKKPAAKPAAKPVAKKPTAKRPVAKPAAKPAAKEPATKPVTKPAKTKTVEKPIPKPKVVKTEVDDAGPRPSVKKTEVEPITEVPVEIVKHHRTAATQIAIAKTRKQITIKSKKRSKTKKKPAKKVKLSKTYGVVNRIVHDRAGRTKNRSIILELYETEVPLEKYLGRKVIIKLPGSDKYLRGTITKLHGKRLSADKLVVVRFNQGVSPHIITARAQIQ